MSAVTQTSDGLKEIFRSSSLQLFAQPQHMNIHCSLVNIGIVPDKLQKHFTAVDTFGIFSKNQQQFEFFG